LGALFSQAGQQLLIFRGTDARLVLLFLHVGGFGLKFGFSHFQGFFFSFHAQHQLQDLIFTAADLLFREFHFVHQSAVFIIGLYAG
jgi:hypothetical protein